MSFDKDELYKLLPAIHRIRDAQQGDLPLQTLLAVLGEQGAILSEDLAQLYDDQFIETCQHWIAPYIGDLIGYHPLYGVGPKISSPRAEVAHTIGYRRRKGTAFMLEELAHDVTDWPARVVEFFQLLATTQFMNHIRSWNFYAPDLRQWEPLERLNTAFESTAHTVDVRRIATQEGRYNIPNIGIFLWRLRAFPLTGSPAVPATPGDRQHFFFSPLGNNMPLFTNPEPEEEITHLAQPINVPEPISRRVLDAYLESYYGKKNMSIWLDGVDVKDIRSCNLSDVGTAGAWAHDAATGQIAIDPVLGRISFPGDKLQATPPLVTFHYGFSAAMGGGEYARAETLDALLQPVEKVPVTHATIQNGLNAVAAGGVVEISDSGRYVETPAISVNASQRIELRAADGHRPTIMLGGDLLITGGANSEVTLNGLLIAGGTLRVPATAGTTANKLKKLRLRHCTFVPGLTLKVDGEPVSPNKPSLIIELENLAVEIDHCILGGLQVIEEANVSINNSIVDATAPDKFAYAAPGTSGDAGGPLKIENSTIIGKVHTFSMDYASNSIFFARLATSDAPAVVPVRSQKKQAGCVRFCFLPPGVVLPPRYRCQPDLALAQRAAALGLPGISALPASEQKFIRGRIAPMFTSLRYGNPGYCQVARRTPVEIREGADDDVEMGAFHDLFAPQRETNLRVRLDEYLRFGLEAGVFYAT
jgi:hypothetical protein